MDILKRCAENYNNMLNIDYDIVLGKRGRELSYKLVFRKIDFRHLVGLHYLKDIMSFRGDRERLFDNIISGKIATDTITKSAYYYYIEDRINLVTGLENFIDSNDLIFKFYANKVTGCSRIEADIMMQNADSLLFLALIDDSGQLYCKSAFTNQTDLYSKNQEKLTLLKKVKNNHSTNEKLVLYTNPRYIRSSNNNE